MRGTAPEDGTTALADVGVAVVVDIEQAREARDERQARREHLLLDLEAARARRRRRVRTT